MKKHVEVEGGELAIRNKKGDIVIIPKGNKKWVEQKLKEKCYECIDKFVSKLPTAASKAQDGSTYPPGNEPTYIGSDLPEVTVTAKAPGWYKNVRQYAKDNPFNIDAYVQERMQNPRGRDKIKAIDPRRYEKELRQEGLKKRQEELQQQAASYIGGKKPKGMTRAEWLNTLSSREEQLVKTDPKYQTSLWQDTKRGLQSLGEMTPVQAAANISKDKGYSAREKQELIQGYMQQPGLSAISDVTKTLSPLAVPSKLVQSTYRKEYGPMEALAGKKNKASLFEDIATDPLTYTGAGLLGKGSKINKGVAATKLNQVADVGQVSNQSKVVTDLLPPPPPEKNWFVGEWTRSPKENKTPFSFKNIIDNKPKPVNPPAHEINSTPISPGQMNLSDFTREEVLAKASSKDREIISKMLDSEFSKTKLKPTGEIVYYDETLDPSTKLVGSNKVTRLSKEEYVKRFNENIDVLNDIITKNNKSGFEYKAVGLDENGRLTFYTPEQEVITRREPFTELHLRFVESFDKDPMGWARDVLGLRRNQEGIYKIWDGTTFDSEKEVIEYAEKELIKRVTTDRVNIVKIPEGRSAWRTKIEPGEWKGAVEDIANKEYYRSIPGLEMSNTSSSVFSDMVARRGTGTYKSINEYLKQLNLGRVKPGFNSQTRYSRGAWEDFVKSGKAVGYYNDRYTIYGTMKNMFPYLGLSYAGYTSTKKAKKQKPQ